MKAILTQDDVMEVWRAAAFFMTLAAIVSMEAYKASIGEVIANQGKEVT